MPSQVIDTTLRDFVKESKKLIAKGQLVVVLDRMRVFFQYSPQLNAIINQQRKLSELAESIRLGIITSEQKTVSKNQISHATLELLDLLENPDLSASVEIQEEVNRAITHSKNLIIDSTVEAQTVNIGDTVINNYYNQHNQQTSLSSLEESLLHQQKRVFEQYLISEADPMFIELPKQKKEKETLSFSTTINPAHSSKDLTQNDIEKIFFDECLSSMLVLGAPGAGKTSLLAELGSKIVQRTLREKKGYLPIFLNLTSWSNFRPAKKEKLTFWDWIISELKSSYGIKGKQYQEILLSKRVVFLLDGLDEIIEAKRLAFLEEFNAFIFEHRVPVAISCRRIEYDLLKQQAEEKQDKVLRLNGAIEIMPIEASQMEAYLREKGYEAIAKTYVASPKLQQVLNSPLWLSIVTNTFPSESWKSIKHEPENWNLKLLEHYEAWIINQKLPAWNLKTEKTRSKNRAVKVKSYEQNQVIHWMAWLAFIMQREDQSILFLERIQPWYLPYALIRKYTIRSYFTLALGAGFLCGMVFGVGFGVTVDFYLGLVLGVVFGLAIGILASLNYLFDFFTKSKIPRIKIVEHFRLTWSVVNPLTGLIGGLTFGLIVTIFTGWQEGLMSGISFGIILGLVHGVEKNSAPLRETIIPNQGLKNCLKYSLLSFIPAIITLTLLAVFKTLFWDMQIGSIEIVPFILAGTIVLAGWLPTNLGLIGYIRHFIVRHLLYKARYTPKDYVAFLNAACRLGYLKRVGGAYRFFHREFQEFLANKYADRFQEDYQPREETLERFKLD